MNGAGNSATPVTSGSNTETTVVSDSTIQTFQNLELQQTFSYAPTVIMPTDMSAYDPFTHRGTCSPFWLLTVEGRTLCVTAASVCQASGLLTPTKKK